MKAKKKPIEQINASDLGVDTSPRVEQTKVEDCLLYTSPSPRDRQKSRMPSSA